MIGTGSSAEVWAIDDDRVLKLYHAHANAIPVALEEAAARAAHALGLKVALPLGRVEEGGRLGIMFERIYGPTMLAQMVRDPGRMWTLVRSLALYQARLHRDAPAWPSTTIPKVHTVLAHRIGLSAASARAKAKALARLDSLSTGDRLCHGDLHPDNMLIASSGPVAIDWSKAMIGDPAADAARTALLIRYGASGAKGGAWVWRLGAAMSAGWYLFCYCRASGMAVRSIRDWRLPVAVAWYRGQPELNRSGIAAWIEREAAR
nr:phosphotransferase [Sphingobium fontiphilum]